MENLIFAFLAMPDRSKSEALRLARSIRKFAGKYAGSPIWMLVPAAGKQTTFPVPDVQLLPFDIDPEALKFPLATKVYAAAAAEAQEQNGYLVWMDTDSLVLNAPEALNLETGKNLGYKPVDHTLIGSPYDQPIDPFWECIYRRCDVPEDRLFPMTAVVDENKIRPYFNAGMLVVRPTIGLLRAWRDNFDRLYRAACFQPFYKQDIRYAIFVHQAILTGTILSRMTQDEMQMLPPLVNYPLHMHAQYPAERRPQSLNEIITCRYDTLFKEDKAWRTRIPPADEPLKSWLDRQVK